MFGRAISALVVLAAAASVAGAPGLTLKVDGPASVDGVDNFKVTTTLTNTGDETLKILNDPSGALSKLPTNTFSITNSKGAEPVFAGIKVKYVPAVAAQAGEFTTLVPGQSVQVLHDLGGTYNLSSTGVDTYEVEPTNLFYLVQPNGEVSTFRANLASGHRTRVSGRLTSTHGVPALTPTLTKRATYVGCTAARQTTLASAAASAQAYALESKNYITAHTTTSNRFVTWFGVFNTGRRSTVLSHFTAISGNTFSSFTYDCTCTTAGTYAYVFPDTFGVIYLCGAFWNAPLTGTDSKAGTLIHEASHFTVNGGTDDWVYGQTGAKNLAISNPTNAVDNADNHEYFAENTPFLS